MDGTGQRWTDWALRVLLQMLVWVGPIAGKYVDQLIDRLGRNDSIYEVLDYSASVELLDTRGERAVHRKRERIRFLKDNVNSFYDYAWGEGEAFVSHRFSPGRVAERQKVGSKFRSLVVLSAPHHRGDEMTFVVRRLVKNGFRSAAEWLEVELYHKTRKLRMTVVVPGGRPITTARLVDQRNQTVRTLPIKIVGKLRQQVHAEVRAPKMGDRYVVEWRW